MAQQKSENRYISAFDVLVTTVIVLILGIGVYGFFIYPKPVTGDKLHIVLRVPAENIEKVAEENRNIYLNGVDSPVRVTSIVKESDNLLLTLEAPGKMENGTIVFNGQRVAINQKAEIHGIYFAQGRIISASNE